VRLPKHKLVILYSVFFVIATVVGWGAVHVFVWDESPLLELFAAANVSSFIMFGLDKVLASLGSNDSPGHDKPALTQLASRQGGRSGRDRPMAPRLPELFFYLIAAAGGSVGILVGMQFFRHKRRKFSFAWKILAVLIIQVALLVTWQSYVQ